MKRPGKTGPQVRILSSPLQNPGLPRVFRISGQLLWLACRLLQTAAFAKSLSLSDPKDPQKIGIGCHKTRLRYVINDRAMAKTRNLEKHVDRFRNEVRNRTIDDRMRAEGDWQQP